MVTWLRSHREGAVFGVATLGLVFGVGAQLAGSQPGSFTGVTGAAP
jgi:hypothetical protein